MTLVNEEVWFWMRDAKQERDRASYLGPSLAQKAQNTISAATDANQTEVAHQKVDVV